MFLLKGSTRLRSWQSMSSLTATTDRSRASTAAKVLLNLIITQGKKY